MKIILIIPVTVLMLTGCVSKNDVAMIDSYYCANTAHNVQQSAQVKSKSEAIKDSVQINCNESDPNCAVAKAMSGVVSAMFISGITPQTFALDAPKTGVNAQIEIAKTVAGGIPFVAIGLVAHDGIKNAGDKTTATEGSTVSQSTVSGDNTETITEVAPEEDPVISEEAIDVQE